MYDEIAQSVEALLKPSSPSNAPSRMDPEATMMMHLANISSVLFHALNHFSDPTAPLSKLPVNWCGFYLLTSPGRLTLGPFQGKVACTTIDISKGVCGAAVRHGLPLCVPDVHAFPGHVACDADTNSEIVIPLRNRQRGIVGVLDIDSTLRGHFNENVDVLRLSGICSIITAHVEFPPSIVRSLNPVERPPFIAMGRVVDPQGSASRVRRPDVKEKIVPPFHFITTELNVITTQEENAEIQRALRICISPDIIFGENSVRFVHEPSGIELHVSAIHFLRSAAQFYGTEEYLSTKEKFNVPCPASWIQKRQQHITFDGKIDWVFRSNFLGAWRIGNTCAEPKLPIVAETIQSVIGAQPTDVVVLANSTKRIDVALLSRKDIPILHYGAFDLLEDELHDCGISKVSIKFRVMETFWLLLVRHFVRVDGAAIALYDTRFFFCNANPEILIHRQVKHLEISKANDGDGEVRSAAASRLSRPEELNLPIVLEQFFEVSLAAGQQ